jgi:hypothetical protein
MSEIENNTSTNAHNKKSPGIITPFSPPESEQQPNESSGVITPLSDRQPGQHIIELGEARPTEYIIKGAPPEQKGTVYHVAKRDTRSKELIQKEMELRRESMIDQIMESLRSNRSGSEIIKDLDADMSGAAIAELVREARSRLDQERAEQQSVIEDRRAEFQRRLQASRFVCPYCKGTFGWTEESEINHLKSCVQYHEHKKQEELKTQRRKNHAERYERLLDFDIPRSTGALSDVVDTINDLKWTEQEAKYSNKDDAIIEGYERIRDKVRSESDYDRSRRQNQIAKLRNAATAIEALYRRLDEPQEEEG